MIQKFNPEKVKILGIKKDPEYLYYVDKDGDVSKTPCTRKVKPNETTNTRN